MSIKPPSCTVSCFTRSPPACLRGKPIRTAVRLCPVIAQLPPLQLVPSPFDLFEYDPFSRAFDGAGRFLEAAGDAARSRIALDISYSLKYGRHPETWQKLCEKLK